MSRETPRMVKVLPTKVKPYHYALWCSVGGGEPFSNEIVHVKWAEDGKTIWFGLETHNFYSVQADKKIELVPPIPSEFTATKYKMWELGAPPRV